MSSEKNILSISELTRKIKGVLSENIGSVLVEGEISNIKRYSSGHTYFVLKDESAQLNAVLFSGVRDSISDTSCLKDGRRVRAGGQISVFEGRGQYQLIVRTVESAGTGVLMERYEALKKKLHEEGLFDDSRKKPLPLLPQRIGVVTSPTGAVIHDMLNVLHRRFPDIQVLLTPVKVQGDGSAVSIARAVKWLNSACGAGSERQVDVIIVGRGGGSLEDLWAFNEEVVARAVAESVIPVISAVGHEVDFALSDFAADLRAPTPSAAAELVIRPKSEFEGRIQQRADDLKRLLLQRRTLLAQRLERLAASAVLTRPEQALARYAQRVDHLEMRLIHAVQQSAVQAHRRSEQSAARLQIVRERRISSLRVRIERCGERISALLPAECIRIRKSIEVLERQLILLNPLKVLDRGYSLTRSDRGTLLRSVKEIEPESGIVTLLKDGIVGSIVSSVRMEDKK